LLCGNSLVVAQTWNQTLTTGDWNTPTNWNTPPAVPNSPTAVAIFATTSNNTTVTLSTGTNVGGIVFNPGATAYTISTGDNPLTFNAAGVSNTSGITQNFMVNADGGITFDNSSTAGSNTVYTVNNSYVDFLGSSSAGSATFIVNSGGGIFFGSTSTGGTATIKLYDTGYLELPIFASISVTIGSLEGTGFVDLSSNNLTVGSNNLSTVFSGVIQDGGEGGSLTKIGTGTLSLTGANTYTGSTTVNGGTLLVDGSIVSPQTIVNPGGTLGGTGVIGGNVSNSGVVQPGDAPGTLTVNGSYTQASAGTLSIRIAGLGSGQHDLLAVGGAASLAGTLQLQQLNGFHFTAPGQTVTFLTAAGGVSGAFSTVHNPFNTGTMIGTEIVYTSTSVSIEAIQESFAALVKAVTTGATVPQANIPYQTQNQFAVAHALDVSLFDPRNAALIAHLDHESLRDVLGDLDRIAPDELTSIYQIAVSQAKVQGANLQRRLEDIRSGSNGFSAAGLAMNGGAPPQTGSYEVAGPSGPDGKDGKAVFTPTPDNRWGVFVTGTGEWASAGDTNNARGYDLLNAGFTAGVDYKVTDHLALGVATGYDYSSADLESGGRVFVNGGKLSLYGTYFTGKGFYTDLAVQGGYNSYDTHRAGVDGFANGGTDGGELNVLFDTGYDFKAGGFTFGPTGQFGYTYLGVESFNERGSLAPLDYPDQHQESIRSVFGAKASYDWKLGSMVVVPELRAGWQHEYADTTFGFDSRFGNGASPDFLVHGPATGRDSLLLGAGFAVKLGERISTYVYYDGELARANYHASAVSGGFRLEF
jgi:outer membrane autotransporter protein